MQDINQRWIGAARTLHGLGFWCAAVVVLLSPWCFGGWEMWWFWPLTGLLFLSATLTGLGTLLRSAVAASGADADAATSTRFEGRLAILLAATAPLLAYAGWRATQPSAPGLPLVVMEVERSLLLFGTPCLLVLVLFLAGTRHRLTRLLTWFFGNAVLIAIYATVNHWHNTSDLVLWVRPTFDYGARAAGPFFCPNHLAAYLNIALCIVIAAVLTPGTAWRRRLVLGVAGLTMLPAWFLTLSRGGTAAMALVLPAVLVAGLRGYRWRTRLAAGAGMLLIAGAAVWAVFHMDNPMLVRIRQSAIIRAVLAVPEKGWAPIRDTFFHRFDRGMYIASALRAWRSNPRIGIGPGQHAIRWPQFAATADGDRATYRWPRLTNHEYYLYEVHSDWVQLLEEYGVVGFALFLLATAAVVALLWRAQGAALRAALANGPEEGLDAELEWERFSPLAALLALTVFAVHSLGDFSLQIPAVLWGLTALTGCGLRAALPARAPDAHASR